MDDSERNPDKSLDQSDYILKLILADISAPLCDFQMQISGGVSFRVDIL